MKFLARIGIYNYDAWHTIKELGIFTPICLMFTYLIYDTTINVYIDGIGDIYRFVIAFFILRDRKSVV